MVDGRVGVTIKGWHLWGMEQFCIFHVVNTQNYTFDKKDTDLYTHFIAMTIF